LQGLATAPGPIRQHRLNHNNDQGAPMPSKLSIAAAALLAAAQISVLCAETLIADLPNLEDLHATGDNRWVIGSAMRAAGRGGALYAIASGGERVGALYPNDTAAAPATTQCPGGCAHGDHLRAPRHQPPGWRGRAN